LFFFSIPCAHAQDIDSARDFVSKLYDAYQHPSCSYCPDTLNSAAKHIFSPVLLRLIRKDQKTDPIDFDPICGCQDPEGLNVVKLEITPTTRGRAAANVLVGYMGNATQTIRISLLHTPRGWRVDDVSTKDEMSLRKLLT